MTWQGLIPSSWVRLVATSWHYWYYCLKSGIDSRTDSFVLQTSHKPPVGSLRGRLYCEFVVPHLAKYPLFMHRYEWFDKRWSEIISNLRYLCIDIRNLWLRSALHIVYIYYYICIDSGDLANFSFSASTVSTIVQNLRFGTPIRSSQPYVKFCP